MPAERICGRLSDIACLLALLIPGFVSDRAHGENFTFDPVFQVLQISPDGSEVLVLYEDPAAGNALVRVTLGDTVVAEPIEFECGLQPTDAAYSPDGAAIAVTLSTDEYIPPPYDSDARLHILQGIDLDNRQVMFEVRNPEVAPMSSVVFSDDSRSLYFLQSSARLPKGEIARYRDSIWKYDIATGAVAAVYRDSSERYLNILEIAGVNERAITFAASLRIDALTDADFEALGSLEIKAMNAAVLYMELSEGDEAALVSPLYKSIGEEFLNYSGLTIQKHYGRFYGEFRLPGPVKRADVLQYGIYAISDNGTDPVIADGHFIYSFAVSADGRRVVMEHAQGLSEDGTVFSLQRVLSVCDRNAEGEWISRSLTDVVSAAARNSHCN
jgi:hypothetical protein